MNVKQWKMKRALCLLLAAVLLSFGGCTAANQPGSPGGTGGSTQPAAPAVRTRSVDLMAEVNPTADTRKTSGMSPEAAAAAADFALRLFRAGSKAGENSLISPLSVLSALAMTANGAKGETLEQMERTLGLSREQYNEFFRGYLAALGEDSKNALRLANSVWFTNDPRFTVNQDFLQTNADFYGAGVYQAPFDNTTLRDINNWVKEKTAGMIPEILDEIPLEAVMYLVNALAFEGKWMTPYNKYSVAPGEFIAANGNERSVDFMYAEEHAYLEDENATGFLKYYEGGRYAFAALLPREGVSVEQYLAALDGAALRAMLTNPRPEAVQTSLPKFEAAWSGELSELLKSMGMTVPFDSSAADFSGLGSSTGGNIFINRVLHKTFISVAEQGTRAGAATAVEMTDEAVMEITRQVYLDRPFVYMLVDCETGLPFFIGTMLDPAG
jgi:serpin B